MSDETGAALTAAINILDQIAREGGPACGAARILPEHRKEVAQQLAAEFDAGATAQTVRSWLIEFERKAATRFIPTNGRQLPLGPLATMSAEQKLAIGSWLEAHRKTRAPTPSANPPARMPDLIRNSSPEIRLAWSNKQARKV